MKKNQQTETAKLRSAVRRFYLIYGIDTEEHKISDMYNHIYGANYIDYKKSSAIIRLWRAARPLPCRQINVCAQKLRGEII